MFHILQQRGNAPAEEFAQYYDRAISPVQNIKKQMDAKAKLFFPYASELNNYNLLISVLLPTGAHKLGSTDPEDYMSYSPGHQQEIKTLPKGLTLNELPGVHYLVQATIEHADFKDIVTLQEHPIDATVSLFSDELYHTTTPERDDLKVGYSLRGPGTGKMVLDLKTPLSPEEYALLKKNIDIHNRSMSPQYSIRLEAIAEEDGYVSPKATLPFRGIGMTPEMDREVLLHTALQLYLLAANPSKSLPKLTK
ncbi:MAG: hypothetical protein GXP63_04125 [DPANN group archaeon]|nr:hypothetical protein [DPANN group archaeon]